jgi:hypothetical protein
VGKPPRLYAMEDLLNERIDQEGTP